MMARRLAWIALVPVALAQTLGDVCTQEHVQPSLPLHDFAGLNIDSDSLTVNAVSNVNIASTNDHPAADAVSYCNVTFAYSHQDDPDYKVRVPWAPAPHPAG